MKRIILCMIISVICIFFIGCNNTKVSSEFNLPTDIEYLIVSEGDSTIKITEKDRIDEIIDQIADSKITDKKSIQDRPECDKYYKVEAFQKDNDAPYTFYLYKDGSKLMIESPYLFISKGSDKLNDLILD